MTALKQWEDAKRRMRWGKFSLAEVEVIERALGLLSEYTDEELVEDLYIESSEVTSLMRDLKPVKPSTRYTCEHGQRPEECEDCDR